MTDDDFVRAILNDPGADAPRLVYADWLEEQSDSVRAEFIRTEVQIANHTYEGLSSSSLCEMIQAMRCTMDPKWVSQIGLRSYLHGEPRTAYQTIAKAVEKRARYIRQASARNMFAEVTLQLDPFAYGGRVIFIEALDIGFTGGEREHDLTEFIAGIRQGIDEYLLEQALAGRLLGDLVIRLIKLVDHPIDSSQVAFRRAARAAMTRALAKAMLVKRRGS